MLLLTTNTSFVQCVDVLVRPLSVPSLCAAFANGLSRTFQEMRCPLNRFVSLSGSRGSRNIAGQSTQTPDDRCVVSELDVALDPQDFLTTLKTKGLKIYQVRHKHLILFTAGGPCGLV